MKLSSFVKVSKDEGSMKLSSFAKASKDEGSMKLPSFVKGRGRGNVQFQMGPET